MTKENTAIVIPARYGSKRFPGKPLALIAGRQMIYRTWLIAKAVESADQVYITTDDQRIHDAAVDFGAEVIMTSESCRNGTERVYQASQQLEVPPQIVVNLQGDAVLTPPWIIDDLIKEMKSERLPQAATAATHLSWKQYRQLQQSKDGGDSSGTLVVFDRQGRALYFSKALIPYLRKADQEEPPVYRHIGIYAFRFEMLQKYLTLPATALEQAEGLEQLRLLEHGFPLQVVEVDYKNRTHWSIDAEQDVVTAEEIIADQGELVSLS